VLKFYKKNISSVIIFYCQFLTPVALLANAGKLEKEHAGRLPCIYLIGSGAAGAPPAGKTQNANPRQKMPYLFLLLELLIWYAYNDKYGQSGGSV
jgi:hypothetical protein